MLLIEFLLQWPLLTKGHDLYKIEAHQYSCNTNLLKVADTGHSSHAGYGQ